jgi:iron complex outermembrane receptor protein
VSGYKPYDTYGNPDLEPEEADTFNVGALVQAGDFKGSLDYWKFKFKNPIGTEGGTDLAAAFFGTATAPLNFCGVPGYEDLQARFTFVGDCSPANLIRTRVDVINGPQEDVSGLDASLSYLFAGSSFAELLVGADASYTLKYEREALIVEGVQIQAASDYAGTRGSGVGSIPDLRGSVYADVSTDVHSVRWTTRYIAGVKDVRPSVVDGHHDIGSFLTHDLVYRLRLPSQATFSASVFNLTDRDPPLVWLDLSYDPFIGNPLGRYFKIALTKEFK